MRKSLRAVALVVVVCILALTAAACSKDDAQPSDPSATPLPSGGEASMIVVTPRPTPVATPTPAASESSGEEESESSSSASSSGSSSGSSGVLKIESEGEDVTEAQQRLESLGYLDKVTGYFGTDTERAVKDFQERNDLDVDGMIGPATLEALMSEDAKEAD